MSGPFTYPVLCKKQKEGGYVVQFPDFPEAITQGETLETALFEAIDCLEEAVANRIEMKLDIPVPAIRKRCHYVSLHTSFAAKLALYEAMREKKITNTSLAKKLKCDEKEVRRLLDPRYNSKFPRIEEALGLLGKRLQIEVGSC